MKVKDLEKYKLIHRLVMSYVDIESEKYESFITNDELKDAFEWEFTEEGYSYWSFIDSGVNLEAEEQELLKKIKEESKYWCIDTTTFNYTRLIKIEGLYDTSSMFVAVLQEDDYMNNYIMIPKNTIIRVFKKVDK